MKLEFYKFNPDAAERDVELAAKRISDDLNSGEDLGGFYGGQLWGKGYINWMGYRFYLENYKRVCVSSISEEEEDNTWIEKIVPPEASNEWISAFIRENSGPDAERTWFIMPTENDIHLTDEF